MSQLSATDISAQAPMKGAAKCDNHCELQNSVNQWILERALHSRDIPGSMPASVLVEPSCRCGRTIVSPLTCVFVCHGCAFGWSEWHMQECSKRAAASATCELALHTFVTDSCGAPTTQQLAETVCPSGLRGWTQVPLAQAAWVQIPQLS